MKTDRFHAPMEAGGFYHVYNRAYSNRALLFVDEKNYYFFLSKYEHYLRPFVETYAYCLIPNHFHLLVEVKAEAEIRSYVESQKNWEKKITAPIPLILSEAFRRFFISYAMSFNAFDKRKGGVLHRAFNRVLITSTFHFFTEVYYIHNNPVKHGLVSSIEEYAWSSYLPFLYGLDEHTNWLCREKMLDWFEGEENFRLFHKRNR